MSISVSTTGNFRPGTADLIACYLLNYNKRVLDIHAQVVEFSVYHNINGIGAQCDVTVIDGQGLIELLPIVGDETLVLSFKTTGLNVKILTYAFRVYKIENRSKIATRADLFTLYCVSQEEISNLINVVNESYSDIPISTIASIIYDTHLKPTEEDFGILRNTSLFEFAGFYAETTSGKFSVTFTGQSPMEAMRYLAQEAQVLTGPSEASNFIFYERSDGWRFETIDSLLLQESVDSFHLGYAARDWNSMSYIDRVTENRKRESVLSYQQISHISEVQNFDTMRSIVNGLYNNEVEVIDPIRKIFETKTFNYTRDADRISHLEYAPDGRPRTIMTANSLFSRTHPTEKRTYIVGQLGDYRDSYLVGASARDNQIKNPRKIHDFLPYMIASMAQLDNLIIQVTLPGNTELEVGNVIDIHVPQTTSQTVDLIDRINLFYDKRFLITSIRHLYNRQENNFSTVLECVKDVYGQNPIEEGIDPLEAAAQSSELTR